MPCNPIVRDGEVIGIACGRNRPKKNAHCKYCGNYTTVLCDYPVFKDGKKTGKTCDIPMCDKCTQKGASGKTDFCKTHFPDALAAYERRMAKATPLFQEEIDNAEK